MIWAIIILIIAILAYVLILWASDEDRMYYKETDIPEISFVDSPVEIDLKLGK